MSGEYSKFLNDSVTWQKRAERAENTLANVQHVMSCDYEDYGEKLADVRAALEDRLEI